MNAKGEMGIGTLIIFIALLLVAAIAAGVLIQTSGSLQEKALTTGDQAKGQIATNTRTVEVSATDGSNSTLKDFTQIVKLAPGSEPIKLSDVLFTMNTFDRTATLMYRDTNGTLTNTADGYYTIDVETVDGTGGSFDSLNNDYDFDGFIDNVTGGWNGVSAILNLSNSTAVTLCNCSGSTFNSNLSNTNFVTSVSGTCQNGNLTSITLTPVNASQGYFAVEYLQRGPNYVEGNLQRGDIIKMYYEAPKKVGEDEKVRLNFIPKIGTPTLTEFITPEVISEERVYLYP